MKFNVEKALPRRKRCCFGRTTRRRALPAHLQVPHEHIRVLVRHSADLRLVHGPAFVDDLVVNIGQVADVRDGALVQGRQHALQHIVGQEGAEVSEVGWAVDSGTTGVEGDGRWSWEDGSERRRGAGFRVVEAEGGDGRSEGGEEGREQTEEEEARRKKHVDQ